ncbi:MAG: glycosyltransferase, partial [Actinomycetota bacterium]
MLTVAIDSGPLHGHRTGIGSAVEWFLDELTTGPASGDVRLVRYVTSARARLGVDERRVPAPAALALRAWAQRSWPRLDRVLGHPDVVHGTNYVVPPTRAPGIVSVYDCWFLDRPSAVHRDVALAARAMQRALADGAVALTSSAATATRLRHHVPDARIETIHLGPPPPPADDESEPRIPPIATRLDGAPFVVSIGTLERRKNVPTLVRAFDRLADEVGRLHLVIAGGEGDDAATTARAIE